MFDMPCVTALPEAMAFETTIELGDSYLFPAVIMQLIASRAATLAHLLEGNLTFWTITLPVGTRILATEEIDEIISIKKLWYVQLPDGMKLKIRQGLYCRID